MKVILAISHKAKRYFFRKDGLWSTSRASAKRFDSDKVKSELHTVRRTLKHLSGIAISAVPVSETVRKNPSRHAAAEGADNLLSSFSGSRASKELKVRSRPIKTGFVVGPLLGVMYEADRGDGKHPYLHRFKKSSRPLLISDYDGSQLGIVGGQYQFTDRGIVDRD